MASSKKPTRPRDVLADFAAHQVVEEREAGVDHQQGCQHVVHQHHTAEGEDAKDVRVMDDQAGEEQQDDCEGLQPVPEALVNAVHVDLLRLRLRVRVAQGSDQA